MTRWLADQLRGPGALRLILATLVFVHHASRLALGTGAVLVFFVLSGYWIQTMWAHKYARTRQPVLTFMVSRVWRLLPVFLVVDLLTMLGFALLVPGSPSPWQNGSVLGMAHAVGSHLLILGYGSLPFLPIGPAWSLDVEVQFYLLAPLAVVALQRWMVPTLAAALVLSVAAWWTGTTAGLPLYAIFFLLGMAAARVRWRPGDRLAHAGLVAALGVVAGCALVPALQSVLIGGAAPGPLHATWNPVLNLAVALLAVPYAIHSTRQRGGAADGMYADLAYIVYLLHWIAVVLLGAYTGALPAPVRLACIAGCAVAVFAVSWLIWRWLDRPINRMRARFVKGRLVAGMAEQQDPPSIFGPPRPFEASGWPSAKPRFRHSALS